MASKCSARMTWMLQQQTPVAVPLGTGDALQAWADNVLYRSRLLIILLLMPHESAQVRLLMAHEHGEGNEHIRQANNGTMKLLTPLGDKIVLSACIMSCNNSKKLLTYHGHVKSHVKSNERIQHKEERKGHEETGRSPLA